MTQLNPDGDKGSKVDRFKLLMLFAWAGLPFVIGAFLSKPLLIGMFLILGGPSVEGGS